MKIVDTRGTQCPMPIIMAKKALNESKVDEQIKIITDNETSFKNLMTFFKDNKINAEPKNEGDFYSIIVSKSEVGGLKSEVKGQKSEVRGQKSEKRYTGSTLVIKSLKMGDGDELLGIMLLDAFMNTLKEMDNLPDTIIFYNEGVKLLSIESPLSKSIKELEETGIKILACGTCVDFYKLKDKITYGTITNMEHIAETLLKAEKVIYP